MEKRVFVTVGTTKFDKLIEIVSSNQILDVLHHLGYTEVQFQTGTTVFRKDPNEYPQIQLNYDQYFEDFHEQLEKSHLVISHAGAGTCLEVLHLGKPLIVVINEDLMDNHQTELAEHLQNEGYLYYANISNLKDILLKDITQLKPYPKADPKVFANYLDMCMAFTK